MISHVAGVVQLLKAQFYPSDILGIGPVPLPPKAEFPYITVEEVIGTELETMQGKSGAAKTLIQVNCWSPSYDIAWEIREGIKDYLLIFSGDILNGSVVWATVKSVNHKLDRELFDGERELHKLVVQFLIWWES